jgi:ABC-2 type transport system permease protein
MRREMAALISKEARMVARDPVVVVLLLVVPIFLALLLGDGVAPLIDRTHSTVRPRGADFAIPGYTLLFAFFQLGFLANSFVYERVWETWPRLLSSPARVPTILFAKMVPYAFVSALQFVVLFSVGRLFLGMHVTGSLLALLVMVVAVMSVVIALGFVVAAIAGTIQQVNAVGNLTIVLAALGGVMLPIKLLPDWAQAVAPLSPHYWGMEGLRAVVLEAGGLGQVLVPSLVLVGIAALSFVLAAWRFRAANANL